MYNDFMSIMFIVIILLNKLPEFLMSKFLIVPKRGVNIFAKDFAILLGAVSNPEKN